jgi:hypothetical protein
VIGSWGCLGKGYRSRERARKTESLGDRVKVTKTEVAFASF